MLRWLLIGLCASAGCEASGIPDPGDPDPDPEVIDADHLYSADRVWVVDLEVGWDALDELRREPRVYVEGKVTIGETTFERVGVRLKGAFSFQNLDGKAAFKIKFNEFVEDQRFIGLERLTLNNMRQDRAQVHEWLGYQVFRAAGVDAPRSGFAQVYVNGVDYGLYANVESVDDRFLRARFEDPTGNLYEAPWGADLTPERVGAFIQDEGTDLSREDLATLVELASRAGDDVFFGDEALIDTEKFLAFVAAEAATGHWDGYWKANNYHIYREPTLKLWSFIPWGIDQTFDTELRVFDGKGFLIEKCLSSEECLAEYARIGMNVADAFEDLDLEASLDLAADLIEPLLETDERRPHALEQVYRHMAAARHLVGATPERLRGQFDCVDDGREADRDGDGYGACLEDCDDGSEEIHPAAAELCDGVDNDCDGFVDELLSCPCPLEEVGGQMFFFCEHALSWNEARARCQALGGELVAPTKALNDELYFRTQEIRLGDWYIGPNDRAEEGTWVDVEGTDLEFEHFGPGEPDDFGNTDCAMLAGFGDGVWGDYRCTEPLPFVCQAVPR